MFGSKRIVLAFAISIMALGSLSTVHASWHEGGLIESFRAWLGHAGNKTTIQVQHTNSGVVLELTGADTATVNRLQAALPERKESITTTSSNGQESDENRKDDDEESSEEHEDHESHHDDD